MKQRQGESRSAFRKRRWRAEHPGAENQGGPVTATEVEDRRRQQDRELQKALDKTAAPLHKEIAKLQAELAARDAAEREHKLRSTMRFDPLMIPVETHKAGAPGMPMTLWSDWHWGETVDIRETGGLNEFNRPVAETRVRNLVTRTIALLRDYAGTRPEYPGIWVMLGGDMVSGLIHEELVETNWGNIVTQAIEVSAAIAGGLLALADEFGKVWVAGVVGNHGRTTKRPAAKGRSTDSYDRAVYQSVAAKFAGDERFHFVIPDDTDYLFDVYGHRFLLTHGDSLGVKGGDGIIGALGPIARGAVKLRNSEGQVGRDFNTLVMGHWHQYVPRGDALGVIVNGTLKGYDEFARIFLRARFARPSQALWLVSPKHGVAAQWCVYVD